MARRPPAPPKRRGSAHVVLRFAGHAGLAALFIAVALLGVLSGVMFAYAGDLPQISALDHYAPSAITRVYARNGETLAEFAIERRLIIGYDDIAPQLREAIISAEDKNFDSHFGISVSAILARLGNDVLHRRLASGASTLTMQLARNLFAEEVGFQAGDKSWERKIKEILVAIQIEKRYTKREIFTFYANQIHFGHGTHGVEAASRLYFNKHAKDLTLEEAAMLAGIIQSPARQSPFVDRNAATRRRNYVLEQMADNGYITPAQAEAAKKQPIVTHGQPQPLKSVAPFFAEEVRKYLEQKYGAKKLYEAGLSVQTGVDIHLQVAANRAVDHGLRQIDKRRGWRRDKPNVVALGQTPSGYRNERWGQPIAVDDVVPAVVMAVAPTSARVRIAQQTVDLRSDGFAWTHRTAPVLFKAGDLIDVRIVKADPAGKTGVGVARADADPAGALLAIDNRTGQIRAMVGGFNFERSKFNRAMQAARQVGSGFKPFVYTAAIDRGYTPSSILIDEPVSYPRRARPAAVPAQELRREIRRRRHASPCARGLAQRAGREDDGHAHAAAGHLVRAEVRARSQARAVSVARARRRRHHADGDDLGVFGVPQRRRADEAVWDSEDLRPRRQPAGRRPAGAARRHPRRHRVRDDEPAARRRPARHGRGGGVAELAARRQDRAPPTTSATRGSSASIRTSRWASGWATTNARRSGRSETGAKAALPIWMEFMRAYIGTRDKDHPPEFVPPGNIVFLSVDKSNGAPATKAPASTKRSSPARSPGQRFREIFFSHSCRGVVALGEASRN